MNVQKQTSTPNAVPPWDDIRYFLELARQGSLSAAARAFGVEHSTVARRVGALEQALALRLFDRLPRRWSLTPEGEALAEQARRIEHEALGFARVALGVSALQGRVRISAPPVLASHFLVPRLAAWRARWPHIELEIVGESRHAQLGRGEADIALRLTRPSEPGLAARALGRMGYGLYAARGYAQRPEAEWEFLGYDDSLGQTPQQRWLQSQAGGRRFALRSNDLAALLQGARAGLGVAALPHFLATPDPGLEPVGQAPCPVSRTLWLVMHPDVRRSPRVRSVADTLIDLMQQGGPDLQGLGPGRDGL